MAIVQDIISISQFREAFRLMGREDNFSREGLEVLFDYLENYSNESGTPVEMDVIAFCCEYEESTIEEIIDQYNIDVSDADGDDDLIAEIVEEYLNHYTSVCGKVDGGFVYASF